VATDYTLLKEAEESGATYMQKLGVKSLAELRALPAERIMGTPYGSDHVIDGWFLPANYAQTYAKGAQANAFVIAGFNKDETGASPETNWERVAARNAERAKQPPPPPGSVPQPPIGLAGYIEKSKARYGALADEYLRLYPASSDHEAFTANNEATRDNGRVSLWMWAGAWRAKATQPVYLYYWTHAAPGPGHDFAGAYHGSEISYAYGHQRAGEPWTDEDRKIGDAMSSYWANYARTGNPNGPGLAPWPAWDGKTEQVMELGDRFQAIPLADPAKVSFWKRFYATQPAG
jgi:para-nitrobenzyl esterase